MQVRLSNRNAKLPTNGCIWEGMCALQSWGSIHTAWGASRQNLSCRTGRSSQQLSAGGWDVPLSPWHFYKCTIQRPESGSSWHAHSPDASEFTVFLCYWSVSHYALLNMFIYILSHFLVLRSMSYEESSPDTVFSVLYVN